MIVFIRVIWVRERTHFVGMMGERMYTSPSRLRIRIVHDNHSSPLVQKVKLTGTGMSKSTV